MDHDEKITFHVPSRGSAVAETGKMLDLISRGATVEASPEPLCSCSMITILIFSLVSSGSTSKMSQHS